MKCTHCGSEFEPESKVHKFCSKNCSNRNKCQRYYYRKHEEQKKRVLKNYHKRVSTEEGRGNERIINRRAKANQRFGIKDRQEVLGKFNNQCVYCDKKAVIIHHLDHNGRGKNTPNNDVENLIACCRSCHAKLHLHNQVLKMKSESDTPSNRR